jgi:hypothetical protein
MNAKLKKYAKLKKQLQMLDNSSDDYKKICSDASKFRVNKYGPHIKDTRQFRIDINSGLTWEECKARQAHIVLNFPLLYNYNPLT